MTADVELLLPSILLNWPHPTNHVAIRDYARACVAHATAAKDTEIEALRAEVKDYRTNGAAAVRFAPSSAHWSEELRRLFGDDARTGIEVLESRHRQELARAERLIEVLRDARDYVTTALREEREKFAGHEDCSDIPGIEADLHKIDSALNPTAAQEKDDA